MAGPAEGDQPTAARPSWSPLAPSTRAFLDEAREAPGFSWFDRVHGYVYARWPRLYIGVATGRHPLARVIAPVAGWILDWFSARSPAGPAMVGIGFADAYHGKVVPLEQATRLVTVDEEIRLTDLEQIIPYGQARDLVLKNPGHIAALDCPCRANRRDPCEPLDVCLIVGEPFASFIVEHHPERSRWISPEEAVGILHAEDERGHVHHAFFKDAMLGRFYAICNCCACCCGAMQAHRTGVPMLAPSGYVACVQADLCLGCGACVDTCQFGALSVRERRASVEYESCMGCGVCVSTCAEGALALRRDAIKGEPLDVRSLMGDAQCV